MASHESPQPFYNRLQYYEIYEYLKQYDVLVVRGDIAGLVAARFSAKHGIRTSLIEGFKTPMILDKYTRESLAIFAERHIRLTGCH